MILDLPFERAPEDLIKRYNDTEEALNAAADRLEQAIKENDNALREEAREKLTEAARAQSDAQHAILDSYIEPFLNDPYKIIDDVKILLEAITKEDFIDWLKTGETLQLFQEIEDEEEADEKIKDLWETPFSKIESYEENFKTAVFFLQDKLYLQISFLDEAAHGDLGALPDLIEEKAAEWCEREQLPQQYFKNEIRKLFPVNNITYSIDKPNNNIWNAIKFNNTNGQFRFITSKNKEDPDINVIVSISWEQSGAIISRNLNNFDKLVYCICAALFNAGNEVFTIQQIHNIITGKNTRPSSDQLKKYEDSINKMAKAHLYISNKGEIAGDYGYPMIEYDAPLLPMERVKATIEGGESKEAIHLFREPPFISFSKDRKQITSFNKSLLHAPLSNTEEKLQLQDFLLVFIAMSKNKNYKTRDLTFETIKEECGIKTKHFKDKTVPKIEGLLEHFKKERFITSYVIKSDRVKIGITTIIND